ncbi:MAG TPA: hypothetical protein PKE45_19400, partial [Caldilineaceae bacterium]|nr:hypothetical protein [Caldilineaceae bacterium]
SPNSSHIVFAAERDVAGMQELFRIPVGGGVSVKLNAPLGPEGDVRRWYFSPDGNYVLYLADAEIDEQVELFSVAVSGGAVVKLNGSLPVNGDVNNAQVTPDGSRVLYWADQEQDEVFELYSVSIQGGPVVKLNKPLHLPPDFEFYTVDAVIAPDGMFVVTHADQDGNGRELYRVPITGGPSLKLNTSLTTGDTIKRFRLSPDGAQLLYLLYQAVSNHTELYATSVVGGSVWKLNHPLADNWHVRDFDVTPNSQYVLYTHGQNDDWVPDLYSVPILGGVQVKLNTLVQDDVIDDFNPTADSSRVVYRGGIDSAQPQLYSAPVTGGTVLHLNQPQPAIRSVINARLSPNGEWVAIDVLLGTSDDEPMVGGLFLVATTGGAIQQVNLPLGPDDGLGDYEFTPDSGFLIFEQGQTRNEIHLNLYAVPLTGGSARLLSNALPTSGSITGFRVAADSRFVLYRAYVEPESPLNLYVAALQEAGGDFLLHLPLIRS